MSRRRRSDERGQTLVFCVMALTCLLGMAALVVDGGMWYESKRSLQSEVDATALAAAAQLPAGQSSATATAASQFAKNKLSGDTLVGPTYRQSAGGITTDTVTVGASRTVSSFFASLFGVSSATIRASASATVYSYDTLHSNYDVMPWGVLKSNYQVGSLYCIACTHPGVSADDGILYMPYQTDCADHPGGSVYQDFLDNTKNACDITIGDTIDAKSGLTAGSTDGGLDSRITTWKTIDQVVSPWPATNGTVNVIDPSSPQLVHVPIVVNAADGSNTFPQSNGQVRVVGFATFFIQDDCATPQSPGSSSCNGTYVHGIFLNADYNDDSAATQAWDPTTGGLYRVALSG